MYNQIPSEWCEAIQNGGFCNISIIKNRCPPTDTIQRAKDRWGDTRPDIFAARWGYLWSGLDDPHRSAHFPIDLKKSSHSLWWFQHKMGAHAYHLGDRVKKYLEGCSGLCSMCKHEVSYQHLFSWCPGITKYRKQWEQEKPVCWTPEQADWLGFPSARYDSLPLGQKRQVLQWLIQAAEIRRDALFNYIQHVYSRRRAKLTIHHTVRAKTAYTRGTPLSPEDNQGSARLVPSPSTGKIGDSHVLVDRRTGHTASPRTATRPKQMASQTRGSPVIGLSMNGSQLNQETFFLSTIPLQLPNHTRMD